MNPVAKNSGKKRFSRTHFGVASKRTLRTMKAAVITEPGQLQIVPSPIPQPDPDQLLVRLEGCGVCASNVPPWEGRPWFSYPMRPGALGHEGWGRVEEVGSAV